MSFRRCLLALPLVALVASASAVEFNENLRAPLVRSGAELKPRLESYSALVESLREREPLDVVKNASLVRERFDVEWSLGRLVDARQSLPELEALGFTARPNGGYSVDTHAHPEWRPLDRSLLMLVNANFLEGSGQEFLVRGMSPEQLDVLRQYVASHDLERMRDESKLRIGLAASKVAKKLQKLKRLDDNFMWSYLYQKSLGDTEAIQRWASGLLETLQPQSQRIVMSYFAEQRGSWSITPTPMDAALQYERELLLRPDFEQLVQKAFKEGTL
jgi:hypothetical protein